MPAKKVQKEAAQFPIVVSGFRPYEPAFNYSPDLASDRGFAPYQPGDVIFYTEYDAIRIGRVVRVTTEYLTGRGYYIPVCHVQRLGKSMNWAGVESRAYPTHIFYAYHHDDDTPRVLPANINQGTWKIDL